MRDLDVEARATGSRNTYKKPETYSARAARCTLFTHLDYTALALHVLLNPAVFI